MRFPFVAVIMLLISCSMVMASEWDNVKSFIPNDNYGKISITNGLGLGSILAEYTLIKNTDICFERCYAEGTATIYTEGNLFQGLAFNSLSAKSVSVSNSKIYLVTYETKEIDVNDYKEVCDTGENKTGRCLIKVIGTHKEEVTNKVLTPYNNEVLEAGEYEWRIEARKNYEDSLDWIVTAYGKELTEWAKWIAGDLAYGNVINYKFDSPNSALDSAIDDYAPIDLTTNGPLTNITDGKFSQAINFSLTGYMLTNTTSLLGFGQGDFAISFWVKTTYMYSGGYPHPIKFKGSGYSISTGYDTDVNMIAVGWNSWTYCGEGANIKDGNWHSIIISRGSNIVTCYVDGFHAGGGEDIVEGGRDTNNNFGTTNQLDIAEGDGGEPAQYQGGIDNVAIWNRNLTYGEILEVATNWTYPSITNNKPVVSINSILPATAYNNDNLNCSYIVTDSESTDSLSANVTWFKDGAMQFSFNSSVTNGTTNSNILNSANTSAGQVWNCSVVAYDGTAYSVANSTTRTISNSRPVAVVNPIQPLTAGASDDLNCSFSVSDDDGDSLTSVVSWYKDDVLQMAFNIDVSLGYNSNILKAGNTTKGEVWNCTVVAYDGALYSYVVNAGRTIGNTAPALPELQFTPSIIYNDTSFHCKAQVTDIDFDNVTAFFNLTVGGWHVAQNIQYDIISGSIISWLVNETYYETGENVTCMLHVNDGTSDSATKEKSFIVSALPPADAWETTSGALWLGILFIAWVIMMLFSVWLLRTAFNMGSFIMGVLGMALGLLTAYNVPAALTKLFNNDVLIRIIIVAFFMLIFILILVNSKKGNGSEM